jgi:cobalt/nickel transport system permease protein
MSGNASPGALFTESREAGLLARIDPRVRLAVALLFAACLALLSAPLTLGLALLMAMLAVGASGLGPSQALRRMLGVEGFLIVLLVTLPFTVAGTPIFSVLGLSASAEGLARALTLVVRVNAAVLAIMALLGGLGGQRLAGAMTGIGVPAPLASLLLLTMRYAATFGDEYRRLRIAMRVRGFRARSDHHTWRSLGYLVGMLLVRSLERAERVRAAMLCRGYDGRFPLAAPRPLVRRDWLFLVAVLAAIAVVLAVEVLA